MVKMKLHQKFENVFWIKGKLCTKNLVPGEQVYDERLIKTRQGEFREWDARRSKPSAAMYKNLHHFPSLSFEKGDESSLSRCSIRNNMFSFF